LTSALVGGDGQLHAMAALTRGRSPRYPLLRRLSEPQSRSGRHGGVKIRGTTETRTLGRPALSQSPHRLRITQTLNVYEHNRCYVLGIFSLGDLFY
jgi:hypothetical protein